MKKALFIMFKEIRDFLQDKGDLSFSLLLPVVTFALIYGAFSGNLNFNGTAYIVNEDNNGKYSELLISQLESYKGLKVQMVQAADADAKLDRSAIYMAVFIPQDFSAKLSSGQPAQLVFKQRGNGDTEAQIVAGLVQGIADGISRNLMVLDNVKADVSAQGVNVGNPQIEVAVQQMMAREAASPTVSIVETTVGSSPDPVNQFLPGILTMYVLFAVNLTAEALVNERIKGTLERLLATRLKMRELFIGKFLAFMARGFLQTLVLLALAYAVFGLFTPVSFIEAMLLALIFSAACSAIGLIIGSLSKTQNQATWISVFFTMLMVMLSGTFIQVSEGTVLGTLSHFAINTYANDAFRTIITKGGSLSAVRSDLLVLVGVAFVGLIVSGLLFNATQKGK